MRWPDGGQGEIEGGAEQKQGRISKKVAVLRCESIPEA